MQYSALMTVMVRAAQKAGRSLRHDFNEVENLQVSRKGPADFVSIADHNAEKILFEELSRVRPDFGWLGEETGARNKNARTRWVVDPLDGTTNFLHALPHFAVSIAVEHEKQVIAGVIYDPIKDELFCAEKGKGAYLNQKRLHVSRREKMTDLLFATGLPFAGKEGHAKAVAQLQAIMPQVAGIRRYGAAALDLAYVAAGRYDGFWEQGLNSWDIAAGVLMVQEAMGQVTDFDGEAISIDQGEVLASNALVHQIMQKLLNC